MSVTNNSIYLAYSQDAVRRLPSAIAYALSTIGFNVFMDKNHFLRFDPPPENILTEIASCDCYVLVLTPASMRWGFNLGDERLRKEVKQASKTRRQFIIICGYELTLPKDHIWSLCGFPDDAYIVLMNELNFEDVVLHIGDFLEKPQQEKNQILSISETLKLQLHAEAALDRGLVEEYDSLGDNRRSNANIYFNEAINIDPNYPDAYYHRAWLSNHDSALTKDAIKDFTHAIRLNPIEARYYMGRAMAYEKQQAHELALLDYTNAIQYAPNTSHYYSSRAMLHKQLGELDNAVNDYTSAIHLCPDIAQYYSARGVIYAVRKEYQLALQDWNETINLDPRDRWHVYRGFLYLDMGLTEQATADYQKALEITRRKDEIHCFKARIHEKRGETEEAIRSAQSALEINPDNKAAQSIIFRNTGM
jgi:tetratricopeptide (TPR) repeat protein